ncbi:MAG: hypothetical protein KDA80_12350, partial [Planctomycetaceae bacterium]|nr:hypothetical protein [Planctomycetaceae bacterium]
KSRNALKISVRPLRWINADVHYESVEFSKLLGENLTCLPRGRGRNGGQSHLGHSAADIRT